jgi:hypothetical protein
MLYTVFIPEPWALYCRGCLPLKGRPYSEVVTKGVKVLLKRLLTAIFSTDTVHVCYPMYFYPVNKNKPILLYCQYFLVADPVRPRYLATYLSSSRISLSR